MSDVVTTRMISRMLWLFIMLSLLTGCFGVGSKAEKDDSPHYYVIDVNRGAVASSFAKDRILRIKPVQVTSVFREKTIVFRVGDDEYQPQLSHQFFSEPQEMFTDQLKRWLQKSGLFSQVVTDADVPADMVLETSLTALYGDQREQFSPQAVLEMQFLLMSENTNSIVPLLQTGLRIEADIDETTPANVVKGWRQGLEELLATLEDDFSGYFSKRSP